VLSRKTRRWRRCSLTWWNCPELARSTPDTLEKITGFRAQSPHLTEDLLREALEGLPPECEQAAEEIREDRIFGDGTGLAPGRVLAACIIRPHKRKTPQAYVRGSLSMGDA
jgi:hypothetical protein